MRDREHSLNKKEGTFRILLLGDSFMEALQVPFDKSFPNLLQDRLVESSHRSVEIINCAVSGWGTDDQLEYLEQYGLKLQPDLILVGMTIHNDVFDNLEEKFHTFANGKLLAKPRYEMPWLQYRSLKIKDFLASHFHLTQLLRKYIYRKLVVKTTERLDVHLSQLIRRDESIHLQRGWDMTFQLFNRIQESGHSVGAETVVFLIPLSIQLYGERLAKLLTDHGATRDEIDLEKPQTKMVRFGQVSGIEIIDLFPNFLDRVQEDQRILHVADGHWNAEGHRLAVDVVSRELVHRSLRVE
jgi:hypothetical protein